MGMEGNGVKCVEELMQESQEAGVVERHYHADEVEGVKVMCAG